MKHYHYIGYTTKTMSHSHKGGDMYHAHPEDNLYCWGLSKNSIKCKF